MNQTLAQRLSSAIGAKKSSWDNGNSHWFSKWEFYADFLVASHMLSGSGFDNGTKLIWSRSTDQKLVFQCDFHHMDENGFYDGRTEHTVIVRPEFCGFKITVSGQNRNEIKYYIAESIDFALKSVIDDAEVKSIFDRYDSF